MVTYLQYPETFFFSAFILQVVAASPVRYAFLLGEMHGLVPNRSCSLAVIFGTYLMYALPLLEAVHLTYLKHTNFVSKLIRRNVTDLVLNCFHRQYN